MDLLKNLAVVGVMCQQPLAVGRILEFLTLNRKGIHPDRVRTENRDSAEVIPVQDGCTFMPFEMLAQELHHFDDVSENGLQAFLPEQSEIGEGGEGPRPGSGGLKRLCYKAGDVRYHSTPNIRFQMKNRNNIEQ